MHLTLKALNKFKPQRLWAPCLDLLCLAILVLFLYYSHATIVIWELLMLLLREILLDDILS